MSATQMDAVTSFQHLVDSVPVWKASLSSLSKHAAGNYEHYIAEYKTLLEHVQQKTDKSDSLLSIHSEEDAAPTPKLSDLVDINPLEAGNRFIYAQARRKRRAGTSLRSNGSGARGVRHKRMVLIYYDSQIQTDLEQLVKAFGAARNNLRKGKNAYTALKGFKLPSLGRRYEVMDNDVLNPLSRPSRSSKAQNDIVVATLKDSSSPEGSFATTDKQLEAVQSLCETAAHQAIRDGDCQAALNEAVSKLDVVLALASSTLDLFAAEKKRIDDNPVSNGDTLGFGENSSAQSTLYEKSSNEGFHTHNKMLPNFTRAFEIQKRSPMGLMSSVSPKPLAMDTIEVDDDEDDDDDDSSLDLGLNLANYRSSKVPILS